MRAQLEVLIDRAYQNPESYLGTVERNTETKLVFLTLWALGWNPIEDIACNFHVPRDRFRDGTAKMARAVDIAIRDASGGICLLGEVKHWKANPKWWDSGRRQILGYQDAIHASRVFLTDGFRWLILNERGELLDEIENAVNASQLIKLLEPYLMKGNVPQSESKPQDWDYGIWPSRSRIKKQLKGPGSIF